MGNQVNDLAFAILADVVTSLDELSRGNPSPAALQARIATMKAQVESVLEETQPKRGKIETPSWLDELTKTNGPVG